MAARGVVGAASACNMVVVFVWKSVDWLNRDEKPCVYLRAQRGVGCGELQETCCSAAPAVEQRVGMCYWM